MMKTCNAAAMAIAMSVIAATAQAAAPAEVTVQGAAMFPESLTSTRGGDLIIGGSSTGAVYRAKKGAGTASVWIDPAKTGIKSVLGVFAHDASNTLYVCSVSPRGVTPPLDDQSNLHTFNLTTGAHLKTYPLPDGAKSVCNDIALDKAGNAYVAETSGGRILRLKKGGAKLEEWSKDERLKGADGLGFIADGQLIVNTVTTGRLFRIPSSKDGVAGAVVELEPSLKLAGPDGIRAIGGNKLLQAESRAARITEITVNGDKAEIRVVKGETPSATSMTLVGNTVWYNNAKFNYLSDPALKGQDPGAFVIHSAPLK